MNKVAQQDFTRRVYIYMIQICKSLFTVSAAYWKTRAMGITFTVGDAHRNMIDTGTSSVIPRPCGWYLNHFKRRTRSRLAVARKTTPHEFSGGTISHMTNSCCMQGAQSLRDWLCDVTRYNRMLRLYIPWTESVWAFVLVSIKMHSSPLLLWHASLFTSQNPHFRIVPQSETPGWGRIDRANLNLFDAMYMSQLQVAQR